MNDMNEIGNGHSSPPRPQEVAEGSLFRALSELPESCVIRIEDKIANIIIDGLHPSEFWRRSWRLLAKAGATLNCRQVVVTTAAKKILFRFTPAVLINTPEYKKGVKSVA